MNRFVVLLSILATLTTSLVYQMATHGFAGEASGGTSSPTISYLILDYAIIGSNLPNVQVYGTNFITDQSNSNRSRIFAMHYSSYGIIGPFELDYTVVQGGRLQFSVNRNLPGFNNVNMYAVPASVEVWVRNGNMESNKKILSIRRSTDNHPYISLTYPVNISCLATITPGQTVEVNLYGGNFTQNSRVYIATEQAFLTQPTSLLASKVLVSIKHLRVNVPAGLFACSGNSGNYASYRTMYFQVSNTSVGSLTTSYISNVMPFLINLPIPPTTLGTPVISSILPTEIPVNNSTGMLAINGTNFSPTTSRIHISSTNSLIITPIELTPISSSSATQLIVNLPANISSTAGSVSVRVSNPSTGGTRVYSGSITLRINTTASNPPTTPITTSTTPTIPSTTTTPPTTTTTPNTTITAPTISSLNPDFMRAGSASFPITITGTGFSSSSRVIFGGNPSLLTPSFVNSSGTQLTVTIPATYIVTGGAYQIRVSNVANISNSINFDVPF